MLGVLLFAATVQAKPSEATLVREATILKQLLPESTMADLKKALPSGTKFKSVGFDREATQIGNVMDFSGAVSGRFILLSQGQATEFIQWQLDPKATSFPLLAPSESDRIVSLSVYLGNGKADVSYEGEKEHQRRQSIFAKVWGKPATWEAQGLTHVEDDLEGGNSAISRDFKVDYMPNVEEGKPIKGTKEDYAALALATKGLPQNRLCITSGQMIQLKGVKLFPFGSRPRDAFGEFANFKGKEGASWGVNLLMLRGKRVISIAGNFN